VTVWTKLIRSRYGPNLNFLDVKGHNLSYSTYTSNLSLSNVRARISKRIVAKGMVSLLGEVWWWWCSARRLEQLA
jgi:hypothetical protein